MILALTMDTSFPLGVTYVTSIFGPLQGFFNLLVFMLPKVIAAKKSKRRGEKKVTWCEAFKKAFWSRGVKDGKEKSFSGRSNLRDDRRPKKAKNRSLTRCKLKKERASAQIGMINSNIDNMIPQKARVQIEEEEKCELELSTTTPVMHHNSNNEYSTFASNVSVH